MLRALVPCSGWSKSTVSVDRATSASTARSPRCPCGTRCTSPADLRAVDRPEVILRSGVHPAGKYSCTATATADRVETPSLATNRNCGVVQPSRSNQPA